jgi:chromate reductase
MKKIIALGGSNSRKSINKQLAKFAAAQLKNAAVTVVELNAYDLPIYSVDLEEANGMPSELKKLNAVFESADGFVVSLAEHNGSYSAAFKNAFDWLSRIQGKVWREKPVLLLATSPGARGGKSVLEAAASRFPYMGAKITGTFSLPSFYENFIASDITDALLKKQLFEQITLFQKTIDT